MGLRKVTGADIRHEVVGDALRVTPLAAYFGALLNGVDWGAVAAMLAALYTLLLILEKLWKWVFRPKLQHSRHPGRYREDE